MQRDGSNGGSNRGQRRRELALDGNGTPLGHWVAPPSHEQVCRNPSRTLEICHGSIVARKEWFQRHRYNEQIRYAVDFDFLFRAHESTRFGNVEEPLYYYRLEQSYSLKKQAVARHSSAKFLWAYHLEKNRIDRALYHALIQYTKWLMALGMVAFGMKKKLLARRYIQLNSQLEQAYQDELNNIHMIQLPLNSVQDLINDQTVHYFNHSNHDQGILWRSIEVSAGAWLCDHGDHIARGFRSGFWKGLSGWGQGPDSPDGPNDKASGRLQSIEADH